MKVTRIAAYGITLAVSSTALWAAQGEAPYAAYEVEGSIQPIEAESSARESGVVLDERTHATISRDQLRREHHDRMMERHAMAPRMYDPRHPQTGQLIDRGLFNRTGPNDFGA